MSFAVNLSLDTELHTAQLAAEQVMCQSYFVGTLELSQRRPLCDRWALLLAFYLNQESS